MPMKSDPRGRPTSAVEVTHISKDGVWLLLEDRELFLPFSQFPWFLDAPVGAIHKMEQPRHGHLYWPALDIDLAVESIEHPERFPLVSKSTPTPPSSSKI
jgi:hypothetical protein